jgi:hypothetical protein
MVFEGEALPVQQLKSGEPATRLEASRGKQQGLAFADVSSGKDWAAFADHYRKILGISTTGSPQEPHLLTAQGYGRCRPWYPGDRDCHYVPPNRIYTPPFDTYCTIPDPRTGRPIRVPCGRR